MNILIKMKKIFHVLIVCYGNTARSPVGEYLGNYYAKKYEVDIKFESCGFINAFSYIQPESRKYLDLKDINYSNFVPQIINGNLLEKQDLILTMEQSHSFKIKGNFSKIKDIDNKTFTLKEFNGDHSNLDIIDPYYESNDTYIKVLKIIDKHMEKAIKKIIEINNSI